MKGGIKNCNVGCTRQKIEYGVDSSNIMRVMTDQGEQISNFHKSELVQQEKSATSFCATYRGARCETDLICSSVVVVMMAESEKIVPP